MRFVCWLWRGHGFWKDTATYSEKHVRVLASMLKRHGGHKLTCVQDGTFDIPGSIVMPMRVAALPNYLPKLWGWSAAFHSLIGERFASIDLDVVVTGDLGPLLSGKEPLRIWDKAENELYNTSLFALEPGFGNEVWGRFSIEAIEKAKASAFYWTGDQSWVGHVLGPGQATFGERDGVIHYGPANRMKKPAGMLAGFMCGPFNPKAEAKRSEWVKAAWR